MKLSKSAKEHIIVAIANEVVGEEVIQAIEDSGGAGAVTSVNGKDGDVILTKSDVGLSNVPNVNATNPANISQTSSYRFVTDIEKAAWSAKQDALGFTAEDSANKATDLTSPDNIKYPTTQAMVTALSGKANSSHTHALSDLTQSGATTGQVVTWSGSAWAAATPAGGSSVWGGITGDLIDQTDLQSALDAKFDDPTGTVSQYIRGDGSLANFPQLGSGGNSVSYYLNGGTSQGTFGGNVYEQMSKIAVVGTGVEFPLVGDGLVCSFITDAGDPNLVQLVAGNWNFEIFASISNNVSGLPQIYAEVLKYDGVNFTSVSTGVPQTLLVTAITAYLFPVVIPLTSLNASDRIAVRIYATGINTRTITVHTQDSHLCQIVTNFTSGMLSLNGIDKQNQFFATGSTGTDFNIVSATDTHTFNIPTASGTNRGALSSSDWTTFNSKADAAHVHALSDLTQSGATSNQVPSWNGSNWVPATLAGVNALTKGTKTIFCIDNGDFATGQAAVNAASQGDTILFGAKAGGWGDIVIPSGKGISLLGLQADDSKYVRTGSITFSPTTGTIGVNEVYISNLYITSATQAAVLFGGSVAARLRIYNCYIAPTSNQKAVSLTNTVTTSPSVYSSVYLNSCVIDAGLSTSAVVESNTPYVRITHSTIDGGSMSLQLNAGTLESDNNTYSLDRVGEIINVAGGTFLCTRSSIVNATTNGSGILLATGAVMGNVSNAFSVATGTGYCIRGTGIHAYAYITFANSALLAYNVKVQNTLTSVPYTVAFTLAP